MKKHLAIFAALLATQTVAAAPKIPALPTTGVYAIFAGKYFIDCTYVTSGSDGGYPYISADGASGFVQTNYGINAEGDTVLASYKAAALLTGGDFGYDITFTKTGIKVLRFVDLYNEANFGDVYTLKYKVSLKLDTQGKYCSQAAARTTGASAESGGKIAAHFKKPD